MSKSVCSIKQPSKINKKIIQNDESDENDTSDTDSDNDASKGSTKSANKKIICEICHGSYTINNKTIHCRTNRHIVHMEKKIQNDAIRDRLASEQLKNIEAERQKIASDRARLREKVFEISKLEFELSRKEFELDRREFGLSKGDRELRKNIEPKTYLFSSPEIF